MYARLTALKTGSWGHYQFREKAARAVVSTPSTAHVKYLVKITGARDINANQPTM